LALSVHQGSLADSARTVFDETKTTLADARIAATNPSPPNIVQVAADAAFIAGNFEPRAEGIAIGLTIAVIMMRHPSQNPMRDAQTTGRYFGR
jgi:hypothetical protein